MSKEGSLEKEYIYVHSVDEVANVIREHELVNHLKFVVNHQDSTFNDSFQGRVMYSFA